MAKILLLLLALLASCSTSSPSLNAIHSTPPQPQYKLPTIHESAILARRILNISSIGTLSTVFPAPHDQRPHLDSNTQDILSTNNDAPSYSPAYISPPPTDIPGSPIGLMEYYALCPPSLSTPTILAVTIANSIQNSLHGSNISLSLQYTPPHNAPPTTNPFLYSPANLPRFSIQGYIEPIPADEVEINGIKECFLRTHNEVIWTPGSDIHESWWARVVVKGVYWFGGFGDRARIGWLPLDEWEGVRVEEIEKARLPGEEGFVPPDWVGDGDGEL